LRDIDRIPHASDLRDGWFREVSKDHQLRADGGVPVVNSRSVAERFEKEHRHVLRDIDAICGGPDLGSLSHQGVRPFRETTSFDAKANREVGSFGARPGKMHPHGSEILPSVIR
jgi:hypothetical protein